MAENEEELYTTIFTALKHSIRRNILRMLSVQPMTFTAIADSLDISTPHLTYHLESLKELVAKEDSAYKLSLFGNAAVDMIKRIEGPSNPGTADTRIDYRKVSAVLVLGLVVVSGLYLNLLNQYGALETSHNELLLEKVSLSSELEETRALMELIMARPPQRWIKGVSLVSGYSLYYRHSFTEDGLEFETKELYAVFYNPYPDAVLRAHPFMSTPSIMVPLAVQKGIAYHNESDTLARVKTWEFFEERLWAKPIAWYKNVTAGVTYDIPLPEAGWYTICMTGPIWIDEEGGIQLRGLFGEEVDGEYVVRYFAEGWVDFRILNEGEPAVFAVSGEKASALGFSYHSPAT